MGSPCRSRRDDTYTDFRDLRIRAGMKLCDVARALGLHDSTVGLWEHGRRPVPHFHVPTLAWLFGITEAEARERLLCGSPPPETPRLAVARAMHVEAKPIADPADASAWKRPDRESRDATQRYEVYALNEAVSRQCAKAFRRTAGRTRYFPSYESVLMGPSVRCRRGHYGCTAQHERRSA